MVVLNSVWCCEQCQYTNPRFPDDGIIEILGQGPKGQGPWTKPGVFCVCGGKMILRSGNEISKEYKHDNLLQTNIG